MHTDVMPALCAHPQLIVRARFASFGFQVHSGRRSTRLEVRDGRVLASAVDPAVPPAFALSASEAAWLEYARLHAPPGYQDIIAMIETGRAELTGDHLLPFYTHLLLVKAIVSVLFTGQVRW